MNDWYVYNDCDPMIFGYNLSLEEAIQMMRDIAAEFPDEAHILHIDSISANPVDAANRAFANLGWL